MNRRSFIKLAVAGAGGAIALAKIGPAVEVEQTAGRAPLYVVNNSGLYQGLSRSVIMVQSQIYGESVISRLLPIQRAYNEAHNVMERFWLERSPLWDYAKSRPSLSRR